MGLAVDGLDFGLSWPALRNPIRVKRKMRIGGAAVLSLLIVCSSLAAVLMALNNVQPSKESPELVARALAAPTLSVSHPNPIYVTDGVPFDVFINVTDTDGDNLNITWEWGDGTPSETYMTDPASTAIMVIRTHTWDVPNEPGVGGYWVTQTDPLRITVEDGTGNVVTRTRTIVIVVPDNYGPEVRVSAPFEVDPSDTVTISANASDPEGEALTWTFVFSNSTEVYHVEVYHTPATAPEEVVWVNVTHVFSVPGDYRVDVFVTDALGDNQLIPGHNMSDTAFITSKPNLLPVFNRIDIFSPSILVLNEAVGYIEVVYKIEVYDPDGDVLNSTWNFGPGFPLAYNESAGGRVTYAFFQTVNYTRAGPYNISVVTTDGRPGHDVMVFLDVLITSDNWPPTVSIFRPSYSGNRSFALPNQTVNFTLSIEDKEGDPISINISFGDGTWLNLTLTEFVEGNVTVFFNHSYSKVGVYLVELWYTDNEYYGLFNHSKYWNLTVRVEEERVVFVDRWSWWDYTSLALVCMIPVLIVINYLRLRKRIREIEQQGMTLDEWKLRKSIEFEESMLEKRTGGR